MNLVERFLKYVSFDTQSDELTTPQYCAYFTKVLYGAMIRPTKEKYNLSSTKHFGDIYHEQDC